MSVNGERKKGTLRPDFNRRIKLDFQGATLSSDTGFLLLREIDERFAIIEEIADDLLDFRSPAHTKHSIVQMIRQRVYQMAAGYEDCNDADFLRVDPALRLALDKDGDLGAGQSMLSRLENDILRNPEGLKALDEAILRAADALIRKKWTYRFILDVDSTDDPTHGKQEGFKVPPKTRKKRHLGSGANACDKRKAEGVNDVWTLDFIHDRLADGRQFKCLAILDEYTREDLALKVSRSITGVDVLDELNRLTGLRGLPHCIRSDNGPEFVSIKVRNWLDELGVKTLFIEPGAPWQNGYVESFNSRFRDKRGPAIGREMEGGLQRK